MGRPIKLWLPKYRISIRIFGMLSSTCTNPSGSGIRGNAAGEGGVAVGRKPGSSEEVGELTVDSDAGVAELSDDSSGMAMDDEAAAAEAVS